MKDFNLYCISDLYGDTRWYNEQGQYHREDGPAIEWVNGYKEWYLNGVKCTKQQFLEKMKGATIKDVSLKSQSIFVTEKSCPTYEFSIYVAGPIEPAKQIIRRECMDVGLCVTIEPTTYVYTGGEEAGYVVSVRNYPRFPKTEEELLKISTELVEKLVNETYQNSGMIVGRNTTYWFSRRT